jgi:hypothetical protein
VPFLVDAHKPLLEKFVQVMVKFSLTSPIPPFFNDNDDDDDDNNNDVNRIKPKNVYRYFSNFSFSCNN